jgi:hypothetical protein
MWHNKRTLQITTPFVNYWRFGPSKSTKSELPEPVRTTIKEKQREYFSITNAEQGGFQVINSVAFQKTLQFAPGSEIDEGYEGYSMC